MVPCLIISGYDRPRLLLVRSRLCLLTTRTGLPASTRCRNHFPTRTGRRRPSRSSPVRRPFRTQPSPTARLPILLRVRHRPRKSRSVREPAGDPGLRGRGGDRPRWDGCRHRAAPATEPAGRDQDDPGEVPRPDRPRAVPRSRPRRSRRWITRTSSTFTSSGRTRIRRFRTRIRRRRQPAEKLARDGSSPRAAAELVGSWPTGSRRARQGIVHRDLKPANILLTESGVPKVATRTGEDRSVGHHGDGGGDGHPSYMSGTGRGRARRSARTRTCTPQRSCTSADGQAAVQGRQCDRDDSAGADA